jgi:hypothetical protein
MSSAIVVCSLRAFTLSIHLTLFQKRRSRAALLTMNVPTARRSYLDPAFVMVVVAT